MGIPYCFHRSLILANQSINEWLVHLRNCMYAYRRKLRLTHGTLANDLIYDIFDHRKTANCIAASTVNSEYLPTIFSELIVVAVDIPSHVLWISVLISHFIAITIDGQRLL